MKLSSNVKTTGLLLLVLASAGQAAPRLSLSTLAVGTINTLPGQAGPTQTLQAYNVGDGSLALTATASASWLSATVGAKATCAQGPGGCHAISIALNTATLAAGTYTEFITLTDPNAVDSPQDIAVTVNTTGVQASITAWTTPFGGTDSNEIFQVFTTGTGVKGTVATTSGGNWLSFLDGKNGLISSPAPWLIQVAAQAGQAPGTYTGTVVITGSSAATDNKTITVTLIVTTAPIIQLNNTSTLRMSTYQGGTTQYRVPTFNNSGGGTLAITAATGSQPWLKGTVSGNSVLIAADPTGLTPGTYNGAITLTSNAANNALVSVPVQLVVAAAGQPMISSGGIVNAANFAAEAVSPGDIVAIFGSQLAPSGTAAQNSSTPLATTLAGVQVLVNNVPAPLYYASPDQVNFQIPYSATGTITVQVVSGSQNGNIRALNVNAVMPRILLFGTYGVIQNAADGMLALPTGTVTGSHPTKPGDVIVLYGIGFGQTAPAAVEGQAASANPLLQIAGVTATFGGGFGGRPTTTNVANVAITTTGR
ncbi:MAG: hypothetical protein EBY17_24975 [Acidobacteriia bacterium]|nr:hypothetical protein [Terriglobia bacterium]